MHLTGACARAMTKKKPQAPIYTDDDLVDSADALLRAIEQEPVPPAIEQLARKLQAAIRERWRANVE